MKPSKIGHQTDIVRPYIEAFTRCGTVAALIEEIEANWSELCPDALEHAKTLTDKDWQYAVKNKGRNASAKRVVDIAGKVLMPEQLLKVGLIATQFKVPDGCAYIRIHECAE